MKDKITQAGFKNQTKLALHIGISRVTINKWSRKPQECPKWFLEYLDLKIENIALRKALKTI
jgi:DNA-binding XRE family transcriptional regulator